MPAAAVAGRVTVTVCALPAVTLNGDAGDMVAPGGKPEIATCAVPLNPFSPVTVAVKVVFDVPVTPVIAVGESARLKSGDELTVSVSALVWVNDPELPVAVTV